MRYAGLAIALGALVLASGLAAQDPAPAPPADTRPATAPPAWAGGADPLDLPFPAEMDADTLQAWVVAVKTATLRRIVDAQGRGDRHAVSRAIHRLEMARAHAVDQIRRLRGYQPPVVPAPAPPPVVPAAVPPPRG